jgi:hypothetical protein
LGHIQSAFYPISKFVLVFDQVLLGIQRENLKWNKIRNLDIDDFCKKSRNRSIIVFPCPHFDYDINYCFKNISGEFTKRHPYKMQMAEELAEDDQRPGLPKSNFASK